MDVPEELLDRLYGAPLGEWVGARDELAKELRGEGRRDEATAVKALRKPPAPVWAANQLARRRPRCIRRLIESAERLREAQASRREDFAAARAEERDALEAAVAEGRTILAEADSDSEAMVARLERTLRAAAATEGSAAVLTSGRLDEELEAAGFEALLGAFAADAPTEPAKRGKAKGDAPRRKAQLEAAQGRVEKARAAATEARKAAREAGRRADAARRDAERAQEEADAAAAAAQDAEDELEAAKAALAELRGR